MDRTQVFSLFAFVFTLGLATSCSSGGGSSSATAPTGAGGGSSPVISLIVPGDGAKGVELSGIVTASFSQDIDPATLTPGTFQLYLGASLANQIPGSVSYDPTTRTATFQPSQALGSKKKYTALLSTKIASLEGVPLASEESWSFETADLGAPEILFVSPGCGSVNIPVQSTFCVEFSEEISPLSALPGTITVNKQTPTGLVPVAGSVQVSSEGRKFCFAPAANLDTDASYIFAVSSSLTDLEGNPLAAPFACSATTIETIQPFVVQVTPGVSATKVGFDAVVQATLSEPVNTLTVGPETLELFDESGAKVEAAFAYDPEALALKLTPKAKLKVFSSYTAKLNTGMQDLVGNPFGPGPVLSPPYTWSFQTVGWEAPELVEHDSAIDLFAGKNPTVSEPQNAANPTTSEVWTVWIQKQESDAVAQVYSNRMSSSGSWQTLESRVSEGTGAASAPQLAIAPDGVPWAVWLQKQGGDAKTNVYCSRFELGAWTTPADRVSNDIEDASAPRIVIAGEGTPFVAWLEPREFPGSSPVAKFAVVYASRFSGNPAAWDNKTLLSAGRENVQSMDLSVDRARNRVYAIFAQKNTEPDGTANDDVEIHAYVNIYETGTGWAAAATKVSTDIQTGTGAQANDVSEPKIFAFDSSGNALAAWIQKTTASAASTRPYASVFTGPDPIAGTLGVWGAPTKLDASETTCSVLRLIGSQKGEQALVAWRQKQSSAAGTLENFWSVSHEGGAWGTRKRVSDNKGEAFDLSLFWEPVSDRVFATWTRASLSVPTASNPDLGARIYSSALTNLSATWDESIFVSSPPLSATTGASSSKISSVTLGGQRRIVAIWVQSVDEGFLKLYSNLEGSFYEE